MSYLWFAFYSIVSFPYNINGEYFYSPFSFFFQCFFDLFHFLKKLFIYWPYPQHMEVPRPGIKPVSSSTHCRVLNSLSHNRNSFSWVLNSYLSDYLLVCLIIFHDIPAQGPSFKNQIVLQGMERKQQSPALFLSRLSLFQCFLLMLISFLSNMLRRLPPDLPILNAY